jgi:hypothetical protein
MKNIYYLILLIHLAGCSRYPSRTVPTGYISESNITGRPFQVVFADQTHKVGDSTQLAKLDYLSSYDIIRIENSGYIILAHFTGLFLEFEGDTIIDMSELSEMTSQQLNIDPNTIKHRTNIQLLFQDERKNNYYQGAVSRCVSHPMAIVSPISTTTEISATTPEICISWEYSMAQRPEEFEVKIKNIFDEPLDTVRTSETRLSLNLSNYEHERLVIVGVSDKNESEIQTQEIGIKIGKQHYFTPQSCDLKSALKVLEMAYYLESHRYYFDATHYYKLASELSDRTIFDELLEHYENRK